MRLQEYNIHSYILSLVHVNVVPVSHDISTLVVVACILWKIFVGDITALLHALNKCIENLRSVHVLDLFTGLHLGGGENRAWYTLFVQVVKIP